MPSNSQNDSTGEANTENLLQGKKGWIVTSGHVGNIIQCQGVLEALGVEFDHKTVSPGAPWRFFAPWGPVPPKTGIGTDKGLFATPWPDIIIGSSRQAVAYMRALKKCCPQKTLTVFLQNPLIGTKAADLIWVSDHDATKLRGGNIISTLLAPHRVTKKRLEQARQSASLDISTMTSPCIAIIVGGSNAVYDYNSETRDRFAHYLAKVAKSGASFLVTPSRRTEPKTIEVIRNALKDAPHLIWDGSGDNPYFEYLSHCDALIVTADSINMTGEAIATEKPVYVFHPDGGSKKFNYFHQKLQNMGITRSFTGEIDTWTYAPVDATGEIAREIATRWHQKQSPSGQLKLPKIK